jgi:hypothetical protein
MMFSLCRACMGVWIAASLGLACIALSGCATSPQNDSLAPMIAVRLATVAAVQGDPVRAQRVADEADQLIADIDAGQSIALDILVPALNSRIAEAALRPPERAVLLELVNVAAAVVSQGQVQSVLPDDAKARLRLVLIWVRAAALGQAAVGH